MRTWLRNKKHAVFGTPPAVVKRRARRRALVEFDRICGTLGPGDVAIDCGANAGVFTEKLARTGAEVHAIDADPYCVERLNARFSDSPNVSVHAAAVGAREGSVAFHRPPGFESDPDILSHSSSILAFKANVAGGETLTVPQIDIAAFVERFPRVSLLKIDIEGAEVEVLGRLLDAGLLSRIDAIFVETHEEKVPELAPDTAALRRRLAAAKAHHVNLDWS